MRLLLTRHQERAFERLYRRHVGDVYRYALVVLRDPDAAEFVTHATFVSALRAHRLGGRPRTPLNRLLGIAHEICAGRLPGNELAAWDEDQALRGQPEGSLTCHEAERAVSRELDGQLPRSERRLLRAHLRSCLGCARFERLHRESRAALRSFETAPVPDGLLRATAGAE
jgi:DNA-directed RNA polymerase specialized sigma24 family protein